MSYKTKLKYLSLATLPIAMMACSSGSCNTDGNNQPVSIGTVTGGASVIVSSGNIPVDASKSGGSVGTLSVPKLPAGQSVTFVMENPQNDPSLIFAPKGSNTTKANKAVDNVSRCTVTQQSPDCTIIAEAAGAQNGNYVANVAFISENPNGTGNLKPINYTVSGGVAPGPVTPGTISMSLSSESISVGSTTTATYTLNGSSGVTAVIVTATSSAQSILDAYNGVNTCALSTAKPTCTITESGLAVIVLT